MTQQLIKIPYVEGWLTDETRAWGEAAGAEFVELDGREDAYSKTFREWWLEPVGDLIVIEQDIIPPDTFKQMLTCEYDWCACWYRIAVVTAEEGGRRQPTSEDNAVPFGWGLGCTRFSERLRQRYPHLGRQASLPLVFGPEGDPDPEGDWRVMDARLGFHLYRLGYLPHDHGEAQHLR